MDKPIHFCPFPLPRVIEKSCSKSPIDFRITALLWIHTSTSLNGWFTVQSRQQNVKKTLCSGDFSLTKSFLGGDVFIFHPSSSMNYNSNGRSLGVVFYYERSINSVFVQRNRCVLLLEYLVKISTLLPILASRILRGALLGHTCPGYWVY